MSDTFPTPSRLRIVLAPSVTPSAAPAAGATSAGDERAPATAAGDDGPTRTVVLRAEGEHEVIIEATTRLTLRVGASALTLDADGTILLHGVRVMVAADEALTTFSAGSHTIRGAEVDIN